MERPNINDYFRMVGGGSKEGFVDTHLVIKVLTDFNEAWEKFVEGEKESADQDDEFNSRFRG